VRSSVIALFQVKGAENVVLQHPAAPGLDLGPTGLFRLIEAIGAEQLDDRHLGLPIGSKDFGGMVRRSPWLEQGDCEEIPR